MSDIAGMTWAETAVGSGIWNASTLTGNQFSGTFDQNAGTLAFTAVPEPHQYALLISGLLFMVITLRRRRAANGS